MAETRVYVVFPVGYAHIDSEWLWGLEEALEACRLTFENTLRLMGKHDFVFAEGSSLYYEFLEKRYPSIYGRVLEEARRERWRISAASYLEFDANMPSGESLLRHLLYGSMYFNRRGLSTQVFFLPDSFGFPATLPKILAGFGIRFFATYKLNWNDTNEPRYNAFLWRSPGGYEVLAYLLPGSYSDYLSSIRRILLNIHTQVKKQEIPVILQVFGRGDHGGGPEEEELLNLEEWRGRRSSLLNITRGGIEEFFKHLDKHRGRLPVINDELYLEFHRGAFTTGRLAKKLNRLNESLVLEAEKLFSLLKTLGWTEYPEDRLRGIWEKILVSQGHDALPATVTRDVYSNIVQRGIESYRLLLNIIHRGLEAAAGKTCSKYIIFNPHSWGSSTYIRIKGRLSGIHQELGDGSSLVYVDNMPPLGFKAYKEPGDKPRGKVRVWRSRGSYVLENEHVRTIISASKGWITSIYDKANRREVLRSPIRLRVMWDYPTPLRWSAAPAVLFDAWEAYYNEGLNKYFHRDLKVYRSFISEKGPLYASITMIYRYRQPLAGNSVFKVEAGLYASKPYLELRFKAYWRARHRFLKLLIPLNTGSKEAWFEAPYGAVKRTDSCLTRNPVNKARYEVCGHRWVDVSDRDQGTAVINDSIYGFSWCNRVLGVSLLRAPTPPEREVLMRLVEENKKMQAEFRDISLRCSGKARRLALAITIWLQSAVRELLHSSKLKPVDQGYHTATIWIYPHRGDYVKGEVAKYASELNTPYIMHRHEGYMNGVNEGFSLLEVKPSHVQLVAVKPCEHMKCLAARLFNTSYKSLRAQIILTGKIRGIQEASHAETPVRKPQVLKGETFTMEFKPYEVKTILLWL